jgi:hypothetical protein
MPAWATLTVPMKIATAASGNPIRETKPSAFAFIVSREIKTFEIAFFHLAGVVWRLHGLCMPSVLEIFLRWRYPGEESLSARSLLWIFFR